MYIYIATRQNATRISTCMAAHYNWLQGEISLCFLIFCSLFSSYTCSCRHRHLFVCVRLNKSATVLSRHIRKVNSLTDLTVYSGREKSKCIHLLSFLPISLPLSILLLYYLLPTPRSLHFSSFSTRDGHGIWRVKGKGVCRFERWTVGKGLGRLLTSLTG